MDRVMSVCVSMIGGCTYLIEWREKKIQIHAHTSSFNICSKIEQNIEAMNITSNTTSDPNLLSLLSCL